MFFPNVERHQGNGRSQRWSASSMRSRQIVHLGAGASFDAPFARRAAGANGYGHFAWNRMPTSSPLGVKTICAHSMTNACLSPLLAVEISL